MTGASLQGSAMKPGKKLVPASFAEVIDSLLDALQSYQDPVVSQPEAAKPESQASPSSMETDPPAQPAVSSAPAASPAENGHAGPSGQAAPTEASAAEEAKAKASRKVHPTPCLDAAAHCNRLRICFPEALRTSHVAEGGHTCHGCRGI